MNERSKEMRARLATVERELAQLKKRRKMLEKDLSRELPEDRQEARRPPGATEAASAPKVAASPGVRPEDAEWGAPPVDESRERFASYFMTGSLGQSGPQLRRERRAMRNKAIVAAGTALILLYALVRFLVN